ncbi:hypothetical protein PGQ11_008953 [Apiospora arundinis]|uniref:Uncharacterized protein n=1 Tax=Apiospora arundinis TaxID=335852 RepID=A0ABR2II18_9PEZI
MCFLWPCPKCFKAARKRYKKGKLEQPLQKNERNKNETHDNKSHDLVQLKNMDHYFNAYQRHHHPPPPIMRPVPDGKIDDCGCPECQQDNRKQSRRSFTVPGSVNYVLANFGGGPAPPPPEFHHNHHHLHGAVGVVPPPVVGMPARFAHPHPPPPPPGAPAHQQHARPPFHHPAAMNEMPNIYICPSGVSELSFAVVDHTIGSPWPPLFYMATLPETAKISDLVARLAPAGSGKTLLARTPKDKGFKCFNASTAASVKSLERRTCQLEVYWDKDATVVAAAAAGGNNKAEYEEEEKPRVTSASTDSTTQTTRKKVPNKGKGKGKKAAQVSEDDDDDDGNNEGKEDEPFPAQEEEDSQRSSADDGGSDGGDDPDDETIDESLHSTSLAFGDSVDLTCGTCMHRNNNNNHDNGEGPGGPTQPRPGGRKVPIIRDNDDSEELRPQAQIYLGTPLEERRFYS